MLSKPSVTFLTLILAVANLFLIGCSDKPLFIELHSASSESDDTLSWNFSDATDYIYDPSKIEFVDGKAQLKQVDQTHQGEDFNQGTHLGTSNNSNILKLRTGLDPSFDVREVLPSKANSLVGYWRLNGNNLDELGLNDGVSVGGQQSNSLGLLGQSSGEFDGIDDHISIPSSSRFDVTRGAVSFWYKSEFDWNNDGADGNDRSVLVGRHSSSGSRNGFLLALHKNGHMYASLKNAGFTASTDYLNPSINNKWHHVVLNFSTMSGESLELYVDGELKNTDIISADWSFDNDPFLIGASSDSFWEEFSGQIDEVSYWNEYLTSNDVQKIYSVMQKPRADETSLSESWTPHYDKIVGYWKMDGNWQDSSGNGNHGTPSADATFSSVKAKVGSQAGSFDGTGDQVTTSNFDLGSISTVSFGGWVKLEASIPVNSASIGYKTNPIFELNITDAGVLRVHLKTGVWAKASNTAAFSDWDQWNHVMFTYDGTTTRLYKNGQVVSENTTVNGNLIDGDTPLLIGRRSCCGEFLNGKLDDIALWNSTLAPFEVKTIYERQKQKFAGHYDSAIIDLGASGEWTNLNPVTSLPFGKEIVAQSNESSLTYPALNGDLSQGLVGYWGFNELATNGISGNDFEDKSISSNHANESGGVILGDQGLLGNAVTTDGVDDYINLGDVMDYGGGSDFTISIWVKLHDYIDNIFRRLFSWGTSVGGRNELSIFAQDDGAGTRRIFTQFFKDGVYQGGAGLDAEVGEWYHFVISKEGGTVSVYGNSILLGTFTASLNSYSFDTILGASYALSSGTHTTFDETAIWSRPLDSSEVQQLYRRVANRLKYQVKSCVDSTCECKSFSVAPLGNANDCDGDGTPNSSDSDDIYKAQFVGPGGNGITTFSELFNRDSNDMNFACNTNTTDADNDVCVEDEITLLGDSNASQASFSFFDFPSSSRPQENRYFQYRVMMEADENTVCDGEPCLPELTSVEIGPTGRYFSGSPSVVNKTSQPLDRSLSRLQTTNSRDCNMSYQISNDGFNFYYWNGSSWATGSEVSESNNLVTLNNNIESFATQVGLGDFFFRSFLGNSSFGDCELDDLKIEKASD